MSANPPNRNQQPSFVVDGVTYTWDTTTGLYRAPNGVAYGSVEGPGGPTIPEQAQAPGGANGGYTWDGLTGVWRDARGVGYGTTEGPGGPTIPDAQVPAGAGNQLPPSYDPTTGANGPTFTPGINFGVGVIPGQGMGGNPYRRQWFDVGPSAEKETLSNTYWNDPSNWDAAWQKVVNQFGGVPGSSYSNFLADWANTGKKEFEGVQPYDPNINVADFIDQYAPQLQGVFGLLSPRNRGQAGGFLPRSRATY